MTRSEIIKELRNYFKTQELVGPDTYAYLGDNSWEVFDTDTLHCLLVFREGINAPFYVNNWHYADPKTTTIYDERGYRDNICDICKKKTLAGDIYLSGHPLGKAIDFKVKGFIAEEVRNWAVANPEKFPVKIRLEWKKNGNPIRWVHFDTKYREHNPKVYRFNV